jgi:signal peptidase II
LTEPMKPTSKSGREDSGRGRALLFSAILSASIIFLDQLVKAEIVASIPENKIGLRLMNDFLWIVHTRNLGIAFSIGDEVSRLIRSILFILVPAVFIVGAILYSAKSRSLSFVQRIAIACIVGGGAGNLIDRIFRPEGVVDFISFSLFGFLGLERFPTFNVADLSISIGAGLLLLSGFLIKDKEEPGHDQGN